MPHREAIDDICNESGRGIRGENYCLLRVILGECGVKNLETPDYSCDRCNESCPLKQLILRTQLNDAMLQQFKCVEKFKFDLNQLQQEDIGWARAWKEWIDRGYAKKFRVVYKDGMRNGYLYPAVIGDKPIVPLRQGEFNLQTS